MNRHFFGPLLTAALSLCFVPVCDIASAQAAPEKTQADYSKEYDKMIQRLDVGLKKTKMRLYWFKAELPKSKKSAQVASYRVKAAREAYEELRAALAEPEALPKSKQEKLRRKLEQQRSLLQKDAKKIQSLLDTAEAYAIEMQTLSRDLGMLSDEVAIERDRFPENDYRRKRVRKIVADSEWVLNKVEELGAAWQSDFVDTAKELYQKTQLEE